MNSVKINNELDLTYPDEFHEMNEAELSRYFKSAANRWGAYNDAEHMVLSVSWVKTGFFSFFSDAETFLIGAESRLNRSLLNYQRTELFKKLTVAKKKARGIRFEYRVNDSVSVHSGTLIAFKHKKRFYAVHMISRKSNAAAAKEYLDKILESISI